MRKFVSENLLTDIRQTSQNVIPYEGTVVMDEEVKTQVYFALP